MGNVPSLKMEVVPADPVTWWLDEVKALRNEFQKRASDQWSFVDDEIAELKAAIAAERALSGSGDVVS
jgi:hypothetical protein